MNACTCSLGSPTLPPASECKVLDDIAGCWVHRDPYPVAANPHSLVKDRQVRSSLLACSSRLLACSSKLLAHWSRIGSSCATKVRTVRIPVLSSLLTSLIREIPCCSPSYVRRRAVRACYAHALGDQEQPAARDAFRRPGEEHIRILPAVVDSLSNPCCSSLKRCISTTRSPPLLSSARYIRVT